MNLILSCLLRFYFLASTLQLESFAEIPTKWRVYLSIPRVLFVFGCLCIIGFVAKILTVNYIGFILYYNQSCIVSRMNNFFPLEMKALSRYLENVLFSYYFFFLVRLWLKWISCLYVCLSICFQCFFFYCIRTELNIISSFRGSLKSNILMNSMSRSCQPLINISSSFNRRAKRKFERNVFIFYQPFIFVRIGR